jgi:hypothetical protein
MVAGDEAPDANVGGAAAIAQHFGSATSDLRGMMAKMAELMDVVVRIQADAADRGAKKGGEKDAGNVIVAPNYRDIGALDLTDACMVDYWLRSVENSFRQSKLPEGKWVEVLINHTKTPDQIRAQATVADGEEPITYPELRRRVLADLGPVGGKGGYLLEMMKVRGDDPNKVIARLEQLLVGYNRACEDEGSSVEKERYLKE